MSIKRIYIDNFKSLVNFEITFQRVNLLLGNNGSGKSTILDVLSRIQALISEKRRVETLFLPSSRTKWQISPDQTFELTLQLPEGIYQYNLLYTILNLPQHSDFRHHKLILCLDEPENFVALREIQPWLRAMNDRCLDGEIQLMLISHHPEIINYLLMPGGNQGVYWFERENNRAPTRQTIIEPVSEDEGISAAELVARGWLPDAR